MENAIVPVPAQAESLFRDANSFDHMTRIAKVFADSQLVPPAFQKNMANCIVGLEIAHRLGASPLMVFQNLHLIKGKPSFSASFMIAAVNTCGRFSPLEFTYVGERGTDEWGCFASAQNRQGKVLKGVTVTIGIAKKDGWYNREGSKWQVFPELMLSYRAATWFCRMFASELLFGLQTADEVDDIRNVTPEPEEKPAVVKKNKGVAAMKNVTAPPPEVKEPAKDVTTPVPGNLGEPAPEPPATKESTVERELDQEEPPALSRVRCEITTLTEKNVKKKDGMGLVTLVGLKGEFSGEAYFDGLKGQLPAVGAVLDLTLEQRIHLNQPIHLIKTFEQVA